MPAAPAAGPPWPMAAYRSSSASTTAISPAMRTRATRQSMCSRDEGGRGYSPGHSTQPATSAMTATRCGGLSRRVTRVLSMDMEASWWRAKGSACSTMCSSSGDTNTPAKPFGAAACHLASRTPSMHILSCHDPSGYVASGSIRRFQLAAASGRSLGWPIPCAAKTSNHAPWSRSAAAPRARGGRGALPA
ncbi:MAG: hypothetical protein J3K34DRAFT_432569 [Monoraphidium minutum]|nr:MAG: hypothetical protein J3K34DRAFT_432569 [Monoraphidium minutum]